MNLGCHCVLFGPRIVSEPESIFPALAASGAAGVEMGARFLSPDTREAVMASLAQTGLVLAGFHLSAPLGDLAEGYAAVEENVAGACDFLADKPYKNIIFTGMRGKNPLDVNDVDERLADGAFVAEVAAGFERLAAFAKARGATLHYHNHSWEFENGQLIYNTLLEKAPTLHMAMDIGWAASSGCDVAAAIAKHPGRFTYLHLRDYKKRAVAEAEDFAARQEAYCAFGEGDAFDWPTLLPQLATAVGENGWLVVEYEKGPQEPERYSRAIQFVQSVLDTKT